MLSENLQLFVSIAGLLIAAIGVPLLYMQLRGLQKSILTATHAAMYHQAAEFRAHLIQYPHLRKYLEHIAVLGDSFGMKNRPALDRFSRVAFERSPILRQHLSRNQASYSDALNRFLKTHLPGSA